MPTCTSQPSSVPRFSLKRRRFSGNITDNVVAGLPARKIVKVISATPEHLVQTSQSSPQHVLESILAANGRKATTCSYDQVPAGFFASTTQLDQASSWDFDLLGAIRDGDLTKLREFHQSGRSLNCSNKFGERLLHLACRKGLTRVVDFLINEVELPVQVVDDMGRTPLHDAFWTPEPNFDVIDLILEKSTDLLYIKDKRGHTPLNYTRKAHWGQWAGYLKSRSDRLASSVLNGRRQ